MRSNWTMMRSLSGLLMFITSALAAAVPLRNYEVTQFPTGYWIENIAVRSNGNLLLTSLLPNASLYEVSRPASKSPEVKRLFTIGEVGSLLDIAETEPDVFILIGGNYSSSAGGIKGSYGLWRVNLSLDSPNPELITHIPEAVLLNGATTAPRNKDLVLLADSYQGLVYRVNVRTGEYDIAVKVPEMGTGVSNPLEIGINGLHVRDDYLWWTNDYKSTIYKVRIDTSGSPNETAEVEEVVKLSAKALDDFVFGPGSRDIAWVTTNNDNRVFAVKPDGENVVVAGAPDSDEVPVATAAEFGRTARDARTLYVTTGAGKSGAKVQAIDTVGLKWVWD